MSVQTNLEVSECMRDCEILFGLSNYTYSNLIAEMHSQMPRDFEKGIPFILKYKQNDLSDLKDSHFKDDMQNDVGNSLEVNLMVKSKDDYDEALYSDAEDSPMEDLSHALEVDLNISNADKQALCTDLSQMGADLSCKDKKKRRKKRKGSTKNPNQIFAFNQDEQKKIEQKKPPLDAKSAVMCGTLSRSATFPVSSNDAISSKDVLNLEFEKLESANETLREYEYGCPGGKSSIYARTVSFPPLFKLTPAIRGGHEKNGLGPRPKLCVKWAPDVHEPPHTSVSHTVRAYHSYQSRKDHKNKHKGKSSHGSGSIESHKLLMYEPNFNTDIVYSRLHSSSLYVPPSRPHPLVPDKNSLTTLKAPIFNMHNGQNAIPPDLASLHSEICHRNEEDDFEGKGADDLEPEGKGTFQGSSDAKLSFNQDSKCARSFLCRIESNQLSLAEATK